MGVSPQSRRYFWGGLRVRPIGAWPADADDFLKIVGVA